MVRRSESMTTFLAGGGLALVIGSGLMIGDFVLHWPTSDDRARLYYLLAEAPVDLALPYLVLAFTAGLAGAWLAGWRGPALFGGVAVGSAVVVGLLFAGTYSLAAWREAHAVSMAGKWARLVTVMAATALAVLVSRQLRLRWFGDRPDEQAPPPGAATGAG